MIEQKNILKRFYVILVALVLFTGFIVYKIIQIQIIDGDHYKDIANKSVYKSFIIEPNRGNLYDTNLNLLATSVPVYEIRFDAVTVSKEDFDKNLIPLSKALSKFSDLPVSYYKNKLLNARKQKNRYLFIADNVDYSEYKTIKSFPLFKLGPYRGGFIAEQSIEREHPMGKVGRRTVGYNNVGLEGAFNEYLKGKKGRQFKQKISKGQWKPLDDSNSVEPQDGLDVVSTIDVNVQDIAHHALLRQLEKFKADHGSVIVMETKTGEIKAISNLGRTKDNTYFEKRNYAVWESHEPGSTFKLMSLAVALEDKVVDTTKIVDTQNGILKYYNRTVRDSREGGYGKISVGQAFAVSSNTAFSQIINDFYKDQPEKFVDRLINMGLNKKIGLEIKGEGQPSIPHPDDKNWYGTTLPWMSFGYGVSMTPLQILSFYNAIANDGIRIKPRFIKQVMDKGEVINSYNKPIIQNSVCSKETANILQELLKKTVEKGTADNIYNESFSMAGKTGTCQTEYWIESGRYIASFAGYFPAENPKYSCIVTIHKPDTKIGFYGSQVAAPVFAEIAEKIYTKTPIKDQVKIDIINALKNESLLDKRIANIQEQIHTMPNLKGMSLMDALSVLENMDLNVRFIGEGKVIKQSIKKGQKIKKNQNVKLILG
ncbi:penicillin-binding protein [Mesohalobacter halotolerans]|uniref:PASTA domain-containing protein n=1 Tax=Mesohalobacter halotolerans TaxID=1883405 RepID=A0A4U5TTF6_9FLAO|nr:penicillin-binding protein [Mesohalobacter halotolerans]TKS57659.1 PASTA domain-containing protein [Mesohalobacter halotolerans]